MLKWVIYILFGVSLCLSLSYADDGGERIAGTVRVIDGDGFMLEGHEVRIHGIDAPEFHQQCKLPEGKIFHPGQESKTWLERLTHGREVYCESKGEDYYNRFLGVCYLKGEEVSLNSMIVEAGHAFAYLRYDGEQFLGEENSAREAKRGLWRFGDDVWGTDGKRICESDHLRGRFIIINGDALILQKRKVRIWGIDAPEGKQSCTLSDGKIFHPGRESKAWLRDLAHLRRGYCDSKGKGDYGRFLGVCYLEDEEISLNSMIVEAGYAFAYQRYSGEEFLDEENLARNAKRGLWRFGEGMWSKDHDAPCAYPETYRHYQSE